MNLSYMWRIRTYLYVFKRLKSWTPVVIFKSDRDREFYSDNLINTYFQILIDNGIVKYCVSFIFLKLYRFKDCRIFVVSQMLLWQGFKSNVGYVFCFQCWLHKAQKKANSPWDVLPSHFSVLSPCAHGALTVRSQCVHRALTCALRSVPAHHSQSAHRAFTKRSPQFTLRPICAPCLFTVHRS